MTKGLGGVGVWRGSTQMSPCINHQNCHKYHASFSRCGAKPSQHLSPSLAVSMFPRHDFMCANQLKSPKPKPASQASAPSGAVLRTAKEPSRRHMLFSFQDLLRTGSFSSCPIETNYLFNRQTKHTILSAGSPSRLSAAPASKPPPRSKT